MIKIIDLFDVLAKTGSSNEASKLIQNIIKGNPTASFDMKVHNINIDEDIIKLLTEILVHCEEQGSQVTIDGISKDEASQILLEKGKLLNNIKTEGKETYPGEVKDAEY